MPETGSDKSEDDEIGLQGMENLQKRISISHHHHGLKAIPQEGLNRLEHVLVGIGDYQTSRFHRGFSNHKDWGGA